MAAFMEVSSAEGLELNIDGSPTTRKLISRLYDYSRRLAQSCRTSGFPLSDYTSSNHLHPVVSTDVTARVEAVWLLRGGDLKIG